MLKAPGHQPGASRLASHFPFAIFYGTLRPLHELHSPDSV